MRSLPVAYVLWGFFGLLGVHRFYCGRIGTGILWLFTGGVFGIGWIVDAFLIPEMVRAANHDPFRPIRFGPHYDPATAEAAPPRVRGHHAAPSDQPLPGAAPGHRVIYCTYCGGPLQVPVGAVGKRFACPVCRTVLLVPA